MALPAIVAVLAAGAAGAVAAPRAIPVELVVSADLAVWQPKGGPLKGTLTLRSVSPRMAMVTVAPGGQGAVVPAGFLPATWSQLVPRSTAKETRGKRITNAVIVLGTGADRRLVPSRLELVGSYRDGSRLAFRVRPLQTSGHPVDRLARTKQTYRDVSILVDPSVTDAIKALWKSLGDWVWSTAFGLPPDPVTNPDAPTGSNRFDSGDYPANRDPIDGYTMVLGIEYDNILTSNWQASGYWDDTRATGQSPTIDRFTVFPFDLSTTRVSSTHACCTFGTASGIQEVTNSSIFKASVSLDANGVEFGGLSLRGSEVVGGTITNSLFSGVDMTGFSFNGSDDDRVSVRGSVFENVKTTVDPTRADVTDRLGGPYSIANTDFTAVAFQDVEFGSGALDSATFQACSFRGVDFSGATISGAHAAGPVEPGGVPPLVDGRFEPTFDGSIFQDVSFDGAVLENVSFAGIDFSAGKVSFDGATLRNVDFTGATGLQLIDWSTVTIEGNVYGLEQVGSLLDLREHPEYLRTITFDGVAPEIDPQSGFDIEPATGYLIDTGTGVRLDRDSIGALIPVDPETGEPLTDQYGDPLLWTPDRGVTTTDGTPVEIDYATGEVAGE